MLDCVSRSYQFLLEGSSMAEVDVAERCELNRETLFELRHYPYQYRRDVHVKTAQEVGSAFDLPQGWIFLTPDVCAGMGLRVGDPLPIKKASQLGQECSDQPLWVRSKILVLLAQHVPPSEAQDAVFR